MPPTHKEPPPPAPAELREICWQIGTRFPFAFRSDLIALSPIQPRLAYIRWHVRSETVEALRKRLGSLDGGALVVRIYDVTDVIFDGFNAHRFFDIGVTSLFGNHYLGLDQPERNLLAELGFRLPDGSFAALCRSNTFYSDRQRPSGRFQLDGLYVSRGFTRVFPVENVLDAPVYERLHGQLEQIEGTRPAGPLSLAMVHPSIDPACDMGGQMPAVLGRLAERLGRLDVRLQHFAATDEPLDEEPLAAHLERISATLFERLRASHRVSPFALLHGHDWVSIPLALKAQKMLSLPLVLSLHSSEHERCRGELGGDTSAIFRWEQRGVDAATLLIVPHSSTRQQVISLYGADPEKVVIIADLLDNPAAGLPDPGQAKRQLQLDPSWPVVLFASEISHAAGADLLMDALIQVCREHGTVQFIFAGEGPLKGELEGRAWHAGVGHRCRFVGDVPSHAFETLLLACDFVVIPARTWQDEGLAHLATSCGKPALITHQSHIRCIEHGQNGLITYDNPGSIIWGVKELLANPLHGNMLRLLAKQKATHTQTLESIAAEHRLVYARALASSTARC